MNSPPPYNRKKLDTIAEQLFQHFALGQGIIMGTSAVVSRKVHLEAREQPGLIHILKEKDAGVTYMGQVEEGKFIHIDVFHHPVEIDIVDLATQVRKAVSQYLQAINLPPPEGEEASAALTLARGIHIYSGACAGTAAEPLGQVYPPAMQRNNHVHILAGLPPNCCSLTFCIVKAAEKALTFQGIELRPVRQIIHLHAKKTLA